MGGLSQACDILPRDTLCRRILTDSWLVQLSVVLPSCGLCTSALVNWSRGHRTSCIWTSSSISLGKKSARDRGRSPSSVAGSLLLSWLPEGGRVVRVGARGNLLRPLHKAVIPIAVNRGGGGHRGRGCWRWVRSFSWLLVKVRVIHDSLVSSGVWSVHVGCLHQNDWNLNCPRLDILTLEGKKKPHQ